MRPAHFSLLSLCFYCRELLAAVVILTAVVEPAAAAMAIRRSWIERRGAVFLIHLRLSARPRWILSQQGSRLQIDLLDTQSSLAPNQFLHAALGALGTVRITSGPQQRVRMEIDAAGKCDYLVGRQRDQLIVSLAAAGGGLNLADTFYSIHAAPSRKVAVVRRPSAAALSAPARVTAPQRIASADPAYAPPLPVVVETPPQAQGQPTVVVDPGHGGHDP